MLEPDCLRIGLQYCFSKARFALGRQEPAEPLESLEPCIRDHALFWARERNGDREQECETPLMASTLVAALFVQNIRPFNHALHG